MPPRHAGGSDRQVAPAAALGHGRSRCLVAWVTDGRDNSRKLRPGLTDYPWLLQGLKSAVALGLERVPTEPLM